MATPALPERQRWAWVSCPGPPALEAWTGGFADPRGPGLSTPSHCLQACLIQPWLLGTHLQGPRGQTFQETYPLWPPRETRAWRGGPSSSHSSFLPLGICPASRKCQGPAGRPPSVPPDMSLSLPAPLASPPAPRLGESPAPTLHRGELQLIL